jgi:lactoylglutathione lyase
MARVTDFDAALRFYVEGFGMKVLMDKFHAEARRVTAMFLGFDDFTVGGCLELAKNWDAKGPYSHGSGYADISIGVPDLAAMVTKLEAMGTEIGLRPTVLLEGGSRVAFVKDPDGHAVELVQTKRS